TKGRSQRPRLGCAFISLSLTRAVGCLFESICRHCPGLYFLRLSFKYRLCFL
ncbi:hypothetical protein HK096_011587, partial [Nowakowskiella sp. JEL0078]